MGTISFLDIELSGCKVYYLSIWVIFKQKMYIPNLKKSTLFLGGGDLIILTVLK